METQVYTPREQAIMEGEMFYTHTKPCRNNHPPLRYASTGQCVECVKGKVQHYRNLAKTTRSTKNLMRADGMTPTTIMRWPDQDAFVSKLQHIIAQRGQRWEELSAFVEMIGSSTMDRFQISFLLSIDLSGKVLNFDKFDHRTGDSGRPETCIRGEWYYDQDIRDLIDRKITHIECVERPKPEKYTRNPDSKAPEPMKLPPSPPAKPWQPPVHDGPNTGLTDADREFFRRDRELYGDD